MSQLPTIEKAREKGWTSIVVDGDPNALYKDEADIFEVVDIRDPKKVYDVAKKYKLDGVVVPGTDFPETAAYVAEKMKLPGVNIEAAKTCANKHLSREVLKAKGFLVPRFVTIKPSEENSGLDYITRKIVFNDMHFPVVVKPIDNMAARGIVLVKKSNDLKIALFDAFFNSRSKYLIVEEFIPGLELSVDSLVYNGEVTIFGIADRHFFLLPYFIEYGHTMPSVLDEDILLEVSRVFTDAVKALGIDFGAAKGDVKVTNKGVMIVEMAARASGGFLSGWTIPYAYGTDPHNALLEVTVGNPIPDLTPKTHYWSAERCSMSIPGRIKEVIDLGSGEHCEYLHLHKKKGDNVWFPINSALRCGSAISKADTRETAIMCAQEAIKKVIFRLEPRNDFTENFLGNCGGFGWFKMFEPGKKEVDWHGCDIEEALYIIKRITGVSIRTLFKEEGFWTCFYKGGIQGGLFYIDRYIKKAS